MIIEVKDGGTLLVNGEDYIFEEYPSLDGKKRSVLNGWIFSLFGIYDYLKIIPDKKIQDIFNKNIDTLVRKLEKYDNNFWSLYDQNGRLASPAYHDLHICLLFALADITKVNKFNHIARKWEEYSKSSVKKYRAILYKVIQKLGESPEGIVVK